VTGRVFYGGLSVEDEQVARVMADATRVSRLSPGDRAYRAFSDAGP
jgi:hypothetical protein